MRLPRCLFDHIDLVHTMKSATLPMLLMLCPSGRSGARLRGIAADVTLHALNQRRAISEIAFDQRRAISETTIRLPRMLLGFCVLLQCPQNYFFSTNSTISHPEPSIRLLSHRLPYWTLHSMSIDDLAPATSEGDTAAPIVMVLPTSTPCVHPDTTHRPKE